jgi:hypothetical protein
MERTRSKGALNWPFLELFRRRQRGTIAVGGILPKCAKAMLGKT